MAPRRPKKAAAKAAPNPRRRATGSSSSTGHRGGSEWDAQAAKAAREYEALHGGLPPAKIETIAVELPRRAVVLGPITRVCYRKRIRSDLAQHAHLPEHERPIIEPEYCHDYGEAWGNKLSKLSDLAAHDDKGRLIVVPRGNNTVTDRGIEDLPAPSGSALLPRRNPVQRGVVLTEIAVRTPSLFTMWLTAVLVGLFGVVLMPLFQLLLTQNTRLSPADRGAAVLAAGVVTGVATRKHPRFSAAITLGGIAAAIPLLVEALRLHYAARTPAGVAVDVLPPQTPSSGVR